MLIFGMGPEWCYQWNDPEFVDKYYKSLKHNGQEEKLVNSVIENLKKDLWAIEVKRRRDGSSPQKADAKDAMYFIDL